MTKSLEPHAVFHDGKTDDGGPFGPFLALLFAISLLVVLPLLVRRARGKRARDT